MFPVGTLTETEKTGNQRAMKFICKNQLQEKRMFGRVKGLHKAGPLGESEEPPSHSSWLHEQNSSRYRETNFGLNIK